MKKMKTPIIKTRAAVMLAACAMLTAGAACAARPRINDVRLYGVNPRMTASNFGPVRTKPVFTGPFQVDLVLVGFPDCVVPEIAEVEQAVNKPDGHTIKEYYDEYTQGITYPVLNVYPVVYMAPQPLGYYCRHDKMDNRIGYEDEAEGNKRGAKLKADALAFARKSSSSRKPGPVTCHVYCRQLDPEQVERHLRVHYPKPKEEWEEDPIKLYDPKILWADPLWPNSSVQMTYPTGGSLIHELGHVIGAPDYYHATEEYDGVEGDPTLPWAWGPTGPAYCRYIYQALVPKACYPTFTTEGEYTLDPRSSPVPRDGASAMPVLGCFIPSVHPNYLFCVEYAHGERAPIGSPSNEGLLISVINVTMTLPLMGPPDMYYTYRRGDIYMKGVEQGSPFLRTGDSFTLKSDPAARIPPLIPAGIEITDIREEGGKCKFHLSFPKTEQTPKSLKDALLPKIRLVGVDEVMPTSMRATCDVLYRGEPLLDEYGFVWGTTPKPTVAGQRFPLFHRDRFDTRILGLKPGTKYYVRAYVKNSAGLTYSKREIEVTTPAKPPEELPLLLTTDHYSGNFHILQDYLGKAYSGKEGAYFLSANAAITLMSMGVYYGEAPGGAVKGTTKGGRRFDLRRVHTYPSKTRPEFRLEEYDVYFEAMKKVAEASGLADEVFGKQQDWCKKCARALKVKDPNKVFVRVASAGELDARRADVRAALERSQPVLLIRQNDFMPGETEAKFPLDTAIIDGIRGDEWHAVFPYGRDRVKGSESGWCSSDQLMTAVVDACLFFYAPAK